MCWYRCGYLCNDPLGAIALEVMAKSGMQEGQQAPGSSADHASRRLADCSRKRLARHGKPLFLARGDEVNNTRLACVAAGRRSAARREVTRVGLASFPGSGGSWRAGYGK